MPVDTKPEPKKRTRRPITPETALASILVTLAKLAPGERQRVLRTADAWLDTESKPNP